MTPTPELQERIRRYLLGQLSDGAREEIEQGLLANAELFEELLVAEDELIDDYLGGKLGADERAGFETHFLSTSERHEKLKFGRAFDRYLSSRPSAAPVHQIIPSRTQWGWPQAFFSSPLRVAVLALVVLGIVVGSWRIFFHQSDVDKGLLALNAAYREQRPVEARISSFSYAPFSQTRGGPDRVDSLARTRAEAILSNAVNDSPTAAAPHHALGRVYLANKKFDEAIKEFDEALKGDAKNAQLYSDLGAAWLEKGRIDKAATESGKGYEELGRGLENLKKALDLKPDLAEAIFNRALCEEQLGLLPEAASDWRNYLGQEPSTPWAAEAARHLRELENKTSPTRTQLIEDFHLAYQASDLDRAWSAFCRARSRAGNVIVDALLNRRLDGAKKGTGDEAEAALNELSFAARVELLRSKDHFTTDLVRIYRDINEQQRDRLLAARSQIKAASDTFNSGEFEKASQLYTQARAAFLYGDNESEALLAESSLGYCYLRLSTSESNVAFFERLLRNYQVKQYRSLYAQSLHALSDAQWGLNRFSDALSSVQIGLRTAEEIQDYPTIVRCLAQIISVHRIFGDFPKSLASFGPAVECSSVLPPDPKLTWQLYQQAAYDFHGLGLDAAATVFELNAVQQAEASGVPLLRSRSLAQLGLLYGNQQRYEEAIKSGELALSEAEHVGGERVRANISAYSQLLLGESHLRAGSFREADERFQAALRLYEQLNLGAYDFQAHKGRFLSLAGLGDCDRADSELRTALGLFESYRREISNEGSRDQFFDQDTYDAAVDFAYTSRNEPDRAFDYAEASRARSLFELMNSGARITGSNEETQLRLEANTRSLELEKIQEGLPEQVQLLEYSVLDDKVLMWVVKDKVALRTGISQTGAKQIDEKVHEFVSLISNPQANTGTIRSRGRDLYDILVKPIEDILDSRRQVCIIADKSLNYLPFAALVSGDGKYLVERFALTRAPSATVFVQLTKQAQIRSSASNELLLSVGDPRFNRTRFESLSALPTAAKEAKEIAAFYSSSVSLIGDAALTNLVKSSMSKADVIHFATHAVADERSPLLSKLLLTPDLQSNPGKETDGVLEASEIYRMILPRTRLVVLSACNTGIERSYRGEGAIGLARPFIAANVPLVVASLWPVESKAASEMMISFHRHRKEQGQSTVEALRASQLAIIENQRSGAEQDYEWAAFTVIGGYATF